MRFVKICYILYNFVHFVQYVNFLFFVTFCKVFNFLKIAGGDVRRQAPRPGKIRRSGLVLFRGLR